MDNVQQHNICTNIPSSQTLDLIYLQYVSEIHMAVSIKVVVFSELLGFGLCPSSGILENRKHNASETGSVSDGQNPKTQ
jgi:hypothetical protein